MGLKIVQDSLISNYQIAILFFFSTRAVKKLKRKISDYFLRIRLLQINQLQEMHMCEWAYFRINVITGGVAAEDTRSTVQPAALGPKTIPAAAAGV